jgi:hypothetical protein
LPGCGAGDQRAAQPMRLSCCALRCRGALLLRSPVNSGIVPHFAAHRLKADPLSCDEVQQLQAGDYAKNTCRTPPIGRAAS